MLKGLGIIGNQIFIQGFPLDSTWEELRTRVDDKLIDHGESPVSYEDKSPIHVNLIRIVDTNPMILSSIYRTLSQLRDIELGIIKLTTVELVVTDFCVSKKHMEVLEKIECSDYLPADK